MEQVVLSPATGVVIILGGGHLDPAGLPNAVGVRRRAAGANTGQLRVRTERDRVGFTVESLVPPIPARQANDAGAVMDLRWGACE